MLKTVLAVALLCVAAIPARAMDPRCDGPARYEAMAEASAKRGRGFEFGHACDDRPARAETCEASQYGVGDGYHGKRAADGSRFNTHANDPFTVAFPPDKVARRNGWVTRSLGSYVTVTNLATGKSIRAKITDRGPFVRGRCIDFGRAGANAVGMGGTARVSVQ